MKDNIQLIDDRGLFLFSHAYELEGRQIELIQSKKIVSMAGTPSKVIIWLDAPQAIYNNPAMPINPEKRYLVLIKEMVE